MALFSRLASRPRSVRTRLMLWNAASLAVILTIGGGIIQYTVKTNLLASVDHDLALRAVPHIPHPPGAPLFETVRNDERKWFAMGPRSGAGPFGWLPSLDPTTQEERQFQESARKQFMPRFLTAQGQSWMPVRGLDPWDTGAFQRALKGEQVYSTRSIDGQPVRILSRPILESGTIIGVIQVPYPLTEVYRTVDGMRHTLLALIPLALLLAGLGGAMLTGHALRPVRQVAQAAEQIEAYDLSQRLEVTGKDEFSQLAVTFNNMLARLEAAFGRQLAHQRRLEQLIAQERRFTADASHELKTPLTVIKANTGLLRRRRLSEEEYHDAVEDMDRAVNRMDRLVQDLLLLAHFDAGQLGRDREPMPVADLIESAVRGVRKPGAAPIRVDIPDASLAVLGNTEELTRLFANLLDNALRYTSPGEHVAVTVEQEGDQVVVCVTDTGCGIAPEHLPHLGERFYRADSARTSHKGGTGLGLAICKGIAEAHGGTLRIESVVGKGTTAVVILPQFYDPRTAVSPKASVARLTR